MKLPIIAYSIMLVGYEDRRGGLNRYDPLTDSFVQYRESGGLSHDFVYGILEDSTGFLWLSTNRSLSRFDPLTETFHNYTRKDGLQSDEFNQGAYSLTRDGRKIFGGVNGINIFDPLMIRDNAYVRFLTGEKSLLDS